MDERFPHGMGHHIKSIIKVFPDEYRLLLEFDDGEERMLDMQPLIEGHKAFAILADKDKFAKVSMVIDDEYGYKLGTIEWRVCKYWPDICPDAAYEDSVPIGK